MICHTSKTAGEAILPKATALNEFDETEKFAARPAGANAGFAQLFARKVVFFEKEGWFVVQTA